MKQVCLILCVTFLSMKGNAQNNIKLYIQQIAANKVYIEYLQKGYKIVKGGLNTIANIKNGHFTLDKDFFAGLQNINPKIRNYAKVSGAIALNIQIEQRYRKAITEAMNSDRFNSGELDYMGNVFTSLINDCTVLADELTLLITANKLKMSDDERIKRIDVVYSAMQDNYVFVNAFARDINIMVVQKSKELQDAHAMQAIHGY